ncbi:3-oxoacyl-[acyl-carrier-protein] reductase [Agromyces humatus]|uniref:3-oxoacyl-[acyl-carrier-protein] reductase n=1 Tax=Agromyces humatus TaxID=279573 RepID=A0ABP4X498_9MICO
MEGRSALVTGSGRGIGLEIARRLASEGARVVVNDLDQAPADETVALVREEGGIAVPCIGSVTDPAFAERVVATAVDAFGGIDIIVNNAGYTWDAILQRTTDQQWDAMLDLHVTAPFRILRAAQPVIAAAAKTEIAQTGSARCRKVVNISSVAGLSGNPGQAAYGAAKAGVTGLTKTIAKEWGRYNVTVNAVAFGLIQTRLTSALGDGGEIEIDGNRVRVGVNDQVLESAKRLIPLGRAGTPAEAAAAVVLLCLPESDYITGETLVCGGGWNG